MWILAVDKSKYGMPIPEDLQDMLDDDPEFLKRFDAMLPGKRRGMIHHIASAKTDATVAKRILKLMQELGLVWALLGWCLSAQAQTLGHARTADYVPLLQDRAVAVVANHTSMVGGPEGTHLVDTLLSLGVEVKHVFAPEHGFRGDAANGAHIEDGTDAATGLDIFSLHGSNRKPQPSQLNGIDVVVFDIQDVGARFYTYVSTLMLVMEACAEAEVDMLVLDRPTRTATTWLDPCWTRLQVVCGLDPHAHGPWLDCGGVGQHGGGGSLVPGTGRLEADGGGLSRVGAWHGLQTPHSAQPQPAHGGVHRPLPQLVPV